MSEKLKASGVANLNVKLKIQKHDLQFAFSQTILIHIDSTLKYTQKNKKRQHISLLFP